mgnify:CR=1 FL=1
MPSSLLPPWPLSDDPALGPPSYIGSDGYRYVLQTGLIGDMRTWQDAQSYCDGVSQAGHVSVLSPYRNPAVGDSVAAINALCVARRKTCWLMENTTTGAPDEKLCPLVTAAGDTVYQGCLQVVSFVCRSMVPVVTPTVPSPSPSPTPSPADGSSPTPAPAPTPTYGGAGSDNSGGVTDGVPNGPARQKTYNGRDGRTYTLFFLGAVRPYTDAAAYCAAAGLELSPYNVDSLYAGDAAFAVKLLCARSTSTTCWLGEAPQSGLCPMLDALGDMHYQSCEQVRSKRKKDGRAGGKQCAEREGKQGRCTYTCVSPLRAFASAQHLTFSSDPAVYSLPPIS